MDQTHILVGPEEKPKKSSFRKTASKFKSSLPQYHLILAASAVIFISSVIIGFAYKSKQLSQKQLLTSPHEETANLRPSDDLSNWRVHTNNVSSFSFNYPDNYNVKENIDTEIEFEKSTLGFVQYKNYEPELPTSQIIIKPLANTDKEDSINDYIVIYTFNNPNELDAVQWYKKYNYFPFNYGGGYHAEQMPNYHTKVGRLETSYGKIPTMSKYDFAILIPLQKHMILISPNLEPNTRTTSDKILSTFKFLDDTDTSDWKTYTNDLYKYALKYPLDEKLQLIDCSNSPNPRDKNKFILGISNQTDCIAQGENYVITIEVSGGVPECKSTSSWNVETDETQVGNQQATKCTYKFIGQKVLPGTETYIQVNFNHDGTFFSAYLKDLNYLSSFNQILSTFKFLDGEEIIKGTVLENNHGCYVDADCYLRVLSKGQEYIVVYSPGWEYCQNTEAGNQGEGIVEGDSVEIFGKVQENDEISTCESNDYYILKL